MNSNIQEIFSLEASPFLIAEIAQNHDGSLGLAHAHIDEAKNCGAHAVKFQTHFAQHESTRREEWRVKFSKQDESRYDYWKRMEFTTEQWAGLSEHCKEVGIEFLSSPFSIPAVELLEKLEVPFFKIGSGEIGNWPLLESIAKTKKPVIVSSGLATWEELKKTVEYFSQKNVTIAALQCTTEYPTPLKSVGLNLIGEIKLKLGIASGLSDHSGEIWPSIFAAASGANFLEVHFCLSKSQFGPDITSSVDPVQLKQIAEAISAYKQLKDAPMSKDQLPEHLERSKKIFGRSIVANRKLEAGCILSDEDISLKKPAGGLGADQWADCIGKVLKREMNEDEEISWEDLES